MSVVYKPSVNDYFLLFAFLLLYVMYVWLVWRSCKGVGHINKVKLRRARLVLGLWASLAGLLSSVFIQATQPCHPFVGRCSEHWRWCHSPLGKKRRVLRAGQKYGVVLGSTGLQPDSEYVTRWCAVAVRAIDLAWLKVCVAKRWWTSRLVELTVLAWHPLASCSRGAKDAMGGLDTETATTSQGRSLYVLFAVTLPRYSAENFLVSFSVWP